MEKLVGKLSLAQRRILLMLSHGNLLKRHHVGLWQDVVYLDYHSPANCQWLLDNELLVLRRTLNKDEIFTISTLGRAAIQPLLAVV